MPRGGKIHLTTEIERNISRIKITDTGHGMNENTRLHAFHPFFTTKVAGTGLGLMVTKNIVEEANGSIHCESTFGKGTTITIQFPV
jgi:signal transduction histidine kinase